MEKGNGQVFGFSVTMKANKSIPVVGPYRHRGVLSVALLLAILSVLFWRSFLPGYVHFANDAPLGQQNAQWCQLPQSITGVWVDLNSVGFNGGAFPPDITTLVRWMLHPVGFSKFFAPIALFILGIGAWTFFRQLKLAPLAAILGALAAALTSRFFRTPAGARLRIKLLLAWISWHWP